MRQSIQVEACTKACTFVEIEETRMSEAKRRMTRQQRFLEEHARVHGGVCYFCGRPNSANSIDHVPPKACFPDGYAPESFESPACKACNGANDIKKHDQIFGFYSQLLDFDVTKVLREENVIKIRKLKQGIANNYPEALPDSSGIFAVNRVGSIFTPQPVALSMRTPAAFEDATGLMGKKLIHALYFREVGKILTREHQFWTSLYQPQRGGTEKLHNFLTSTLPDLTLGQRLNIKDYGDRFRYISGYKQEDFFVFAAQFGQGIILWGMACGPGIEKPNSGPLRSVLWLRGACGPGATSA